MQFMRARPLMQITRCYWLFLLIALAWLSFVSLGLPDGLNGVAWPSIRAEFHLLDAEREWNVAMLNAVERKLGRVFVANVQIEQSLARVCESAKVWREWNAWQLAFQVRGKARTIAGMMQQCVNVVENVPLRNSLVAIMTLK